MPHSYYSLFPSLEKSLSWDFLGGLVVRNPPANAGDTGLIPYATEQLSGAPQPLKPTRLRVQAPQQEKPPQ